MDKHQKIPRHGAPLTAFQETLYDILMGSVGKDIVIETDVFQSVDSILNIYQKQNELLLADEAQRAQNPFKKSKTYPNDGIAVQVVTIMEQISGPVQENLKSIILFMVVFLLLYLQIVQGWMAKESTKVIQMFISLVRWIIMTLLGGYFITSMMKKTVRSWNRLARWVEAPMDDEL